MENIPWKQEKERGEKWHLSPQTAVLFLLSSKPLQHKSEKPLQHWWRVEFLIQIKSGSSVLNKLIKEGLWILWLVLPLQFLGFPACRFSRYSFWQFIGNQFCLTVIQFTVWPHKHLYQHNQWNRRLPCRVGVRHEQELFEGVSLLKLETTSWYCLRTFLL